MGTSRRDKILLVTLVIFGVYLQFLNISFLGSGERVAKWLAFSLVACATGILWAWKRDAVRLTRLFLVAFPCWVLILVSAWQGHAPYDSLLGSAGLGLGLLVVVLVADVGLDAEGYPDLLTNLLLIAGTVASLLGLYENFHYLWLGPSPAMLIPGLLPPDMDSRVVGHFGQPNQLALFLTLCLLVTFYGFLHGRAGQAGKRLGVLRYLPVVLIAWAFFLTQSRAGFLSFFIVFAFIAWLMVSGRYLHGVGQRREFLRLLLCLLAGYACFEGIPWLIKMLSAAPPPGAAASAARRALGAATVGSDGRYIFWTSALLLFADHPWFGVGLGGYKYFLPEYAIKAHDLLGFVPYENLRYTYWAHNELLQLFCETGIVPAALVVVLVALYFRRIWKYFLKQAIADERPFFLYSHLFLLPYLLQAQFEWVFRNPGLLVLFFLLLGGLLSQYPMLTCRTSKLFRRLMVASLLAGVGLTGLFIHQELKTEALKQQLLQARPLDETLPVLVELMTNPYGEFVLLDKGLPVFIEKALQEKDSSFSRHLLPYAERSAHLRGVWQDWYSLALLYLKTEDEKGAAMAVQRAIDVQPSSDRAWHLLHYLNILEAARRTGQPLENFLPDIEGGEQTVLEHFYGGNRVSRRQQDL